MQIERNRIKHTVEENGVILNPLETSLCEKNFL